MTKAQIKERLQQRGAESSMLDDLVHDAASTLASNANNGGMEAQIEFLMDTCGWGADDIINRF